MKCILALMMGLVALGAIGCSQLDAADAEALDRLIQWEEDKAAIEGPHIRLQSHPLCRWIIDGKPGYGSDPADYDDYTTEKYGGHFSGLRWRIESYEGVKELAIEFGAANPDVVVSEWCDKRDTPPLAYTPTPG